MFGAALVEAGGLALIGVTETVETVPFVGGTEHLSWVRGAALSQ